MTFHGSDARRPSHLRARAREPAGRCWCRCWRALARSARWSPGFVFQQLLHRRGLQGVLGQGAVRGPRTTTSCTPCTRSRIGSAGRRRSPCSAASRSPTSTTSPCRRCRRRPRARFRPLYLFLLNKWYFDELYDLLFVRPAFWIGRLLWKRGDGTIIDGLGPDGIANRVLWTTGRVVKLQTGYVYHYAFAMLIGVALIVTCFMFAAELAMTSTGFGHSLAHHLPAAGRRAASSRALNEEAHAATPAGSRSGRRSSRLALSLFLWVELRSSATRASSSSRRCDWLGGPSATRWASTASRCCSSS